MQQINDIRTSYDTYVHTICVLHTLSSPLTREAKIMSMRGESRYGLRACRLNYVLNALWKRYMCAYIAVVVVMVAAVVVRRTVLGRSLGTE